MKKFLIAMGVAAFTFVGCDDSSSASAGPNDEPAIESSSAAEHSSSSSSAQKNSSSSEKAKSSSSDTQNEAKQSSSSEKTGTSSSSMDDALSSSVKSESSSSVEDSLSSSIVATSSSSVASSSSVEILSSSSSEERESSSSSAEEQSSSSETVEISSCSEYVEAISSSDVASSSSVMSVYDAENNTLTDLRDNRVYKTVTIGEQIWMAENMSYEMSNSSCYNDTTEYCEKYGRLYTWDTVGICPEGWHLPDNTEWEALFTAVGGQSIAGTMLKSQSGWIDNSNGSGNGTDSFGFTALPAGYRGDEYEEYNFHGDGEYTFFWSASEFTEGDPYYMNLYFSLWGAYLELSPGGYRMSVRCVKD